MRWYKQDSGLYDRAWAKDPKAVTVYLYLHCAAYVQPGMYHGHLIRRGSCPTSRAAIMEATGLSEYDVKSRLKILLNNNEIILKTSNVGTIATICDYDGYNAQEDLFEQNMSSELPSELPSLIYNKTGEYKNNIVRSVPSNKERESGKALVYEIKEIYNRTFSGQLVEWKRLSEKMIIKVETCIQRFGRQSVDMVFDQIKNEPFSLGDNTTGFQADFDFIFRIDQYEKYLERYKLRMSKKKPEPQPSVLEEAAQAPKKTVQDSRRELLVSWIDSESKRQTERGQDILITAYQNGEMKKLGIDWKPNNIAI